MSLAEPFIVAARGEETSPRIAVLDALRAAGRSEPCRCTVVIVYKKRAGAVVNRRVREWCFLEF